jgi:hypothetical protein
MVDFAHPVALGVVVIALPMSRESVLLFVAISAVFGTGALLLLWWRIRRVSVQLRDGRLYVQNIFRSYSIPVADIGAVILRRPWFAGIYCYCFGLRLKSPSIRPRRSIPVHALSGGEASCQELEQLIGVPPDGAPRLR